MAAAFDVEAVERFVEEKDVSFLSERAGDVSSLLLAAGELVDLAIGNVFQLHRGERGFALLLVDFAKAFEMTQMRKASHLDDVAYPEREVLLMLIDLWKVSDFAAGLCQWCASPENISFLQF